VDNGGAERRHLQTSAKRRPRILLKPDLRFLLRSAVLFAAVCGLRANAFGQVPPTPSDLAGYTGLFAAAARGEAASVSQAGAVHALRNSSPFG